MNFEDMVARIKATAAMPNKDINDNLFGGVARPTADGLDWIGHLVAFAEAGDGNTLDLAAALCFDTLRRTPGISVDYTVNVLDFRTSLHDRLAEAGHSDGKAADAFADHMRRKAYEFLPALSALGTDADISFVLDVYRRMSYFSPDPIGIEIDGVSGAPRFREGVAPTNVTDFAGMKKAAIERAETVFFVADTISALALRMETEDFNLRELGDLPEFRTTSAKAFEVFVADAPPSVSERMASGIGVIEERLNRRPKLQLVSSV